MVVAAIHLRLWQSDESLEIAPEQSSIFRKNSMDTKANQKSERERNFYLELNSSFVFSVAFVEHQAFV